MSYTYLLVGLGCALIGILFLFVSQFVGLVFLAMGLAFAVLGVRGRRPR